MPLYEYLCESCGRTFEVVQRFSDAPLTVCDRCGGALKKLLSPPAVQFKGSGWYVSDYGRGSGRSAAGSSGEEKKDSAPPKDPPSAGEGRTPASGKDS